MLTLTFVLLLLVIGFVGFFLASRFDNSYPLFLRLIVLMPAITAFATIFAMIKGDYVPYAMDVVKSIDCLLLYLVVASRFTAYPLLDMKVTDKGIVFEKRKPLCDEKEKDCVFCLSKRKLQGFFQIPYQQKQPEPVGNKELE